MRYIWQHIQAITQLYDGNLPLTHFLKKYFKQYPKLGSRDRKILSEMSYCWYRCSKALPAALPFEEKLKAALFICNTHHLHTRSFLPESWQAVTDTSLEERRLLLEREGMLLQLQQLVTFNPLLSNGMDTTSWLSSIVSQPDLFIRVRTSIDAVKKRLAEEGISVKQIGKHGLSLPNGTDIQKLLQPADYVIQDASSQETGRYFQPAAGEHWWDCCAGAGGKSLLLKDIEPSVHLTVSDKRASILHNLRERFHLYGHTPDEWITIDMENTAALTEKMKQKQFDHIICDVPCTGSGTWARTPEQLFFFEETLIKDYAERQRRIAINASQFLAKGATLFYITCSVFQKENEDVVAQLVQTGLNLKTATLINGINLAADSMFIAVLEKD